MRPTAALLSTLALALGAAGPAAGDEMLVDGVAAQVGSEIVLVSEVMQIIGPDERRLRAAGASEVDVARLRAEGLDALIEVRLLERLARDMKLEASEEQVDQTVASIARQNGLTPEQLQESVTRQGMAYADYRAEIKRELERRNLVSAMVGSKVRVEEEEIQAAYRERFGKQPEGGSRVHLRQILIPAGKEFRRSVADACREAAKLRDAAAKGEPFEKLAAAHSVAAPERGGDIGWIHEEMAAGWMKQLIEGLEPGQVSQPHRLPVGCTLLQVVERETWEPVSYESARTKLHNQLYDQKVAVEYRKWIEDLRARTFIERRGYFADAAAFSEPETTGKP